MNFLVIRGDLQSQSGYAAAARDYAAQLAPLFDRVVGSDIHYAVDRPYQSFPYPLLSEAEVVAAAAQARFALVLSITTPDHYSRVPDVVNIGLTFWETDRFPPGASGESWVGRANLMDELWSASTFTKTVFEQAGVGVPIHVIPWPTLETSASGPAPNVPLYDLDQIFALRRLALDHLASGPAKRPGPLAVAASALSDSLLGSLPRPSCVEVVDERTILCVAQDVPRKALSLLLAEWIELKRNPDAAAWKLVIKTSAIDPRVTEVELLNRFVRHVAALKRQLQVAQSRVYLCLAALPATEYARLLKAAFAGVSTALGEGFCAPIVDAMSSGKPVVVPRHTAFADYVPDDFPYSFATHPAVLRFARDPLRVYHPASTWHVPDPGAVAAALTRLIRDAASGRAQAVGDASRERMRAWCGPERVGRLLAGSIERLRAGQERVAQGA